MISWYIKLMTKEVSSIETEEIIAHSNREDGYKHEILSKSNIFIGTKYKASVMENQITYLAMLKIQNREYEALPDGIYVRLRAGEIKKAIGNSSGTFYTVLSDVANAMTGNNMGLVDEENQRFTYITLINYANYDNGIFTIRFANELKNNLIGIKDNFTKLPKNIAMSFKKPYSFPLYQLLKSQCFYPYGYNGIKNNKFIVEVNLAELKLEIGVVNANQTDVKRILSKGHGTAKDYEKAVQVAKDSKETMFNTWSDFSIKCLTPTIREINKVSDIYVEYQKISGGRGGKAVGVEFTVWLNGAEKTSSTSEASKKEKQNALNENEKFAILMNVFPLFSAYNLQYTDIREICEVANYNQQAIEKAARILNLQTKKINDVVRWTIKCIQEDYQEPKVKPEVPHNKKETNSFNNFTQREYDFNELEKKFSEKIQKV